MTLVPKVSRSKMSSAEAVMKARLRASYPVLRPSQEVL